ncbi:hypothetical protein SAMN02799624_02164 [Paenibacillus sp. UNC496MF]|nr:hypothetical protein SAMN02799624_02164 [Paenibacillus sp. UNC496MF]
MNPRVRTERDERKAARAIPGGLIVMRMRGGALRRGRDYGLTIFVSVKDQSSAL